MSKKYLDDTGLSALANEIRTYFQKKLTPGTNITIDANNVISASGGSTVTSIDGLSGGTLTSPLIVSGGDAATASKIILNTNGQITDTGTATLFGRSGTGSTLIVGHSSFTMTMRGSATRPTYNGNNMALSSDIPNTSNFLNKTGDTITGNIKLNGGAITTNDTYSILRVYNNKIQIGSSSKTTEFLSRPQYNSTNFALATDSAPSVVYTTTAPTAANTTGLKFALLDSEPSTKYSGWIYLIKES